MTSFAKEGEEAARTLALRLLKENPKDSGIKDVAHSHVVREMKKLEEKGMFDQALAFIGRNRELLGSDAEVGHLKVYCWQEWIRAEAKQGDEEAAKQLMARLLQDNAGDRGLQEVIRSQVIRGKKTHEDAKQFEKALTYLGRHRELLRDEGEFKQLAVSVYDAWAMQYKPVKDWPRGIAVYRQALEQFPGDSHLTNNLKYFEQQSKK